MQFLNSSLKRLLTSFDRLYPSKAYITLQGKKVKAMADQLTTVSKKRLINRAGIVTGTELEGIARAISIQLDL